MSPSVLSQKGRGMRGVALMCPLGLMLVLNHFLFVGSRGVIYFAARPPPSIDSTQHSGAEL